jgi:hypothetical protein
MERGKSNTATSTKFRALQIRIYLLFQLNHAAHYFIFIITQTFVAHLCASLLLRRSQSPTFTNLLTLLYRSKAASSILWLQLQLQLRLRLRLRLIDYFVFNP